MKQIINQCLVAFFMILTVIILIFLLLIMSTSSASAETVSRDQILVIGKVTAKPKTHYKTLKPMADYVVSKMGNVGIKEARVLLARDNNQMISYLKQGKVDWVTETPFSALLFQEKTGAEFLLRRWKKGVAMYHTIFFSRKDSGINSLSDLKGRTIAFEDSGSTSAFFIPASTLIRKGLKLVQLASPREKPAPGMVGYIFSRQEVNTFMWVHKGIVDAGAFSNLDWSKEDRLDKSLKPDLRIIHRTKDYPRALELVRKNLDPKLKNRLKEILVDVSKDPEAKNILKIYDKTKKFDELDDETRSGLEEVRELLKIVRNELS